MLRNYQEAIVNTILNNRRVAIWAEMGLGKTRCVIEALKMLGRPRTLIVAPKLVSESTWIQEFEKWDCEANVILVAGNAAKRILMLTFDADYYVISRDNLDWLTHECKIHFPVIVLDESSSFKNVSSKRFKAAKVFCANAERVIELTGTPASNGYIDLWAQIYLLDFGKRLGKYITHFREHYFTGPVINGYKIYKKPYSFAIAEINEKIKDITFSLRAIDNLKLPDRIDNVISISMSNATRNKYKTMKKNYIIAENITASNAAVLTGKLAQLANGFVYSDDKETINFSYDKLERLKEIIDTSQENILIYAIFQRDIDLIKNLSAVQLNSAERIKEWNEGKIKVAVAQPQSIGMGVNLQAGGHVLIWYSLTWSLETYQQANARLYRQGQEHTVTINHMITKDTIEEDIYNALQNKTLTQDVLLNSVKMRIQE